MFGRRTELPKSPWQESMIARLTKLNPSQIVEVCKAFADTMDWPQVYGYHWTLDAICGRLANEKRAILINSELVQIRVRQEIFENLLSRVEAGQPAIAPSELIHDDHPENTCRECPAWDPLLTQGKREPLLNVDGRRLGRCKFDAPKVLAIGGDKGVESFFPFVLEDDWCLPGRGLIYQTKQVEQEQAEMPQLDDSEYREF